MVKDWMLIPKIRHKTSLFDCTTPIKHSTGSTSQCSKTRKTNKRHTDLKEETKLSLFTDILENSWDLQKTPKNRLAYQGLRKEGELTEINPNWQWTTRNQNLKHSIIYKCLV